MLGVSLPQLGPRPAAYAGLVSGNSVQVTPLYIMYTVALSSLALPMFSVLIGHIPCVVKTVKTCSLPMFSRVLCSFAAPRRQLAVCFLCAWQQALWAQEQAHRDLGLIFG